jgi:ABC-type multidrug transport system ATPase subunit
MTPTPAIRADGLSYAYGDHLAVDDVSFAVAPGEILGFLGPNGAGKSTTIKMLVGQLTPKRGTVVILGHDGVKARAQIQPQIGVTFEEKNLYTEMTGKENLVFFARLFGISDLDVGSLMRRVDLADRMDDRVAAYSKGMRQRLMVARCLVNRPAVLFLDEPTAGLDPVSSRAIRAIVREEAQRGAAVLLTTHDMLEADKLSDRVAFINEGRILALDTPENLKLAYGKRSVRVRRKAGDEVRETVISLEEDGASKRVEEAVATEGLLSVHTEEASLEDIFVQLAGRRLDA